MLVLILSDVHANLEALQAVLDHVGDFDVVWFLGDAVGYGPDPNACVELMLESEPSHWLAGNHDWAALGQLDTAEFNHDARLASQWTATQLTEEVRAQLAISQPATETSDGRYTLAHGSPRFPIWEYILDAGTAAENFEEFSTGVCLFGHTHVPVVFEQAVDGAIRVPLEPEAPFSPGTGRYLINPGSVGQPRDGDPRASYMTLDLDSGSFTLHRVDYDISTVQSKILDAGLPAQLAVRLDYGW
jgi:predicted phosphodiesterase